MRRAKEKLTRARDLISVGKVSGVVGTYGNLDPRVEEYVCRKLGLKPARISTQIVPRDLHAEFFSLLAVVGGSIERIAGEIRGLQRTEVLELEESFGRGQKGSSAMPHKRNPILSENLTGLARLLRSYAQAALENIALWHERDISHSSVERVIGPDATILLDFALNRLRGLVEGLVVYRERMEENLNRLGGLIYSEAIMIKLQEKGLTRDQAYALVQRNAQSAWKEGGDFRAKIESDPEIKEALTAEDISECFDLKHHLRFVDLIFQRVFTD
jgi:adenylosuccinate lyase